MNSILQGTTPDLLIIVSEDDFKVEDVVKLELTFLHNGTRTIHGLDDVEVDAEANGFRYQFTERETLALSPKKTFTFQLRFYFADGNIIGTEKMILNVSDLLSEEVMTE